MKEKLVVIVGPTAVGKTKASIALAKTLNGEIISGDSMQVYKGMDIGTAKIKEEEMEGIPHHLLDIKNPKDDFSVAEFQSIVKPLISEINQKGKIPIIVGGTGLYIKAITHDYQFPETSKDERFREQLETFVKEHGPKALHQQLVEIDPISAQKIHPNNYRRVIRALEVYQQTSIPVSQQEQEENQESPYQLAMVGLTIERKLLYDRINLRVDMMVEEGLIEEVRNLYEHGVRNCQSMLAIGYKEVVQYLEGNVTLEEAIEQLKQNSRRYAKRQLTWFRNKAEVTWFEMSDAPFAEKLLEITKFVEGKLDLK